MRQVDVAIIGAGAAGLMCAATAGYRGRKVLLIDHSERPGVKVLAAGGGRCNFTNREVGPDNFLCDNPHFTISALKRYTQYDFIDLVERHSIDYEERELGRLFCRGSSRNILEMLLTECEWAGVGHSFGTEVKEVAAAPEGGFIIDTSSGKVGATSLVLATGGLTLPESGSSPLGYEVAKQFGLKIIPPKPGLVPLALDPRDLEVVKKLSGIALRAEVETGGASFRENLLFTHRGLSGPAILQASNYWEQGQVIRINLFPELDLVEALKEARQLTPKALLCTVLARHLTKRVANALCALWQCDGVLAELSNKALEETALRFTCWDVVPSGTEGFKKAEVTLGGIGTGGLSSKTLEAKDAPGLYAIGEVTDVTGQLGGYNLQWAWASGYCAGLYV